MWSAFFNGNYLFDLKKKNRMLISLVLIIVLDYWQGGDA
jgi:hypothetical protein